MRSKPSTLPYLALAFLLIGAFGATAAFARANTAASQANSTTMSAIPAIAPLVSMQTVDMSRVPAASANTINRAGRETPITGVDPAVFAARKVAAASSPAAPKGTNSFASTGVSPLVTGTLVTSFNGQKDSASTCPYWGGCEHPDMALAASPNWVFQGVNEAYTVYDTHGNLQSGWPKNYVPFFGVPGVGSCDPQGPYMVDPRAFYDPVDQRFWAVTLQDEGAFGYNNCPFASLFWVAVSQTNNPNGKWNVYSFDMARGSGLASDYTEAGFNQSAIYFSSNMLNKSSASFQYAEVFSASKAAMEAGKTVTAKGFTQLKAGSTLVDSVQPVEKEQGTTGPEFLASSFNTNSGGGNCVNGCSGVAIWAFANALKTPALSEFTVSTSSYTMPPLADEPGHSKFVETFDTRIGGSPVFQKGQILFSFETGVNNGSRVVPGIFWAQVKPTVSSNKITGATLTQSGLIYYSGDQDASYSAIGSDSNGNLVMVFITMSSSLNPTIMYATHTSSNAKGSFSTPVQLIKSTSAKVQSYYGDYSNTSFDGSSTNDVWIAGEYVGTSDWNTYFGEIHFS